MTDRLGREALLILAALLLAMVAIGLPELGSDPWPFRTGPVDPSGPLAPLVRAAGEEWDVGIARAAAFLAALLVGAVGALALVRLRWPRFAGAALILAVGVLLMAPSTLLQMGLRDSTEPWFHTNDSTYQIEIAGDLLLDFDNPYGHDFRDSGMERFYTRDGSVSQRVLDNEVALRHYAYFPGTAITAAVWRLLPNPLDDYRLLVLLATLATLGAVMLFPAPLAWRLAIGALVVCNPIAVRSAWFGQNDAPSIGLMILAFALFARGRWAAAGAGLAAAVLLKQFALVAAPFLAIMLLKKAGRPALTKAAIAFAATIAVCCLPFFIADPVAFYEDTVKYGAGTYKIVGYGLSAILVRAGILEDRDGSYPFAIFALLLWAPVTAWLLWVQWRARELWVGAVGFTVSILVLMFIGRTFNNYYLVWPMMGAAIAALMASGERLSSAGAASSSAPASSSSPSPPGPSPSSP